MSTERFDVVGEDPGDFTEYCYEQGWSDGLPVVPPTPRRVEAMLSTVSLPPEHVVGIVPPASAAATVDKVAVNAVMAGCKPDYFPVVLAAVRAVCDPRFNLNGVQTTTHPCAPLTIVNGPIRKQIGMNSGHNVFGQGFRANATIGRALRLVLQNIGGARPGITEKSTQGHPGKFTFCIAENEEESPWEPLHVTQGLPPGTSAVTVFACDAPHSINNQQCRTAIEVLYPVADCMSALGNNNVYFLGQTLVVFSPEHAHTIAQSGWTKSDVRQYLFEQARNPHWHLKRSGHYNPAYFHFWPRWIDYSQDNAMFPVVAYPDDILLVVAGGSGRFSQVLPGWGLGGLAVTYSV